MLHDKVAKRVNMVNWRSSLLHDGRAVARILLKRPVRVTRTYERYVRKNMQRDCHHKHTVIKFATVKPRRRKALKRTPASDLTKSTDRRLLPYPG